MPKKSDSKPGISLALGIAAGLVPWGSQMIGVTINLPLGCLILAAAFALVCYAFWLWEGGLKWHRVARIATVTAAAVAYFSLIGFQIRAQWIKDHSPAVATSNGRHIPVSSSAAQPATSAAIAMPTKPRQPPLTPKESAPTPAPPSPATYSQDCVGSACAQGPGSHATYNQYGPQKLVMSEAQKAAFIEAMSKFSGMTFEITLVRPNPTTEAFAEQFCQALQSAGMNVHSLIAGACAPPFSSVSPLIGGPQSGGVVASVSQENLEVVNIMGIALRNAHVINDKVHVSYPLSKSNIIEIMIVPYD